MTTQDDALHVQSSAGLHAESLNIALLPKSPLYKNAENYMGWQLSPVPYALSAEDMTMFERLGLVLWRFQRACDTLYDESIKGKSVDAPAWVAELLDIGKPSALTSFAAMKRFRRRLPVVLRPDLLRTESGFALTELDSVPGGIGFTSALNQAYRGSGFTVVEPSHSNDTGHHVSQKTMPQAFVEMLIHYWQQEKSGKVSDERLKSPVIAIVLSDEAADYRQEMIWLVEVIRDFYPNIYLLHPKDVDWVRDRLVFTPKSAGENGASGASPGGQGEIQIDLIYRFFELFDLPNIPKIELIQYAIKKGAVLCTPPFKAHLEEKAWLALVHHPMLQSFWGKQLGEADVALLHGLVPPSWLLNPEVLPRHAIIPGLTISGHPVQSFDTLLDATQKERQRVIKPSGFSELAWGSRGVVIGHDESAEIWNTRLREALAQYETSPHILQDYHKPVSEPLQRLDTETGQVHSFAGRTRLCPYYFVSPESASAAAGKLAKDEQANVVLAGVLATSCPADKKIIHGMKGAIMAPCHVV